MFNAQFELTEDNFLSQNSVDAHIIFVYPRIAKLYDWPFDFDGACLDRIADLQPPAKRRKQSPVILT